MAEGYLLEAIRKGDITPFSLGAASGDINGLSSINKFGKNPDVDSAASEDIWDYGGTYQFSTTADITKIISSAADTVNIDIYGLDGDYLSSSQTVTLSGTTFVTLTTPLMRVNRMINCGATDLSGGVYLVTSTATHTGGVPDNSTDVRAFINGSENQTLMAIYTVPSGKTAYMTKLVTNLGRALTSNGSMELLVRPYGEVFQVKRAYQVSNTDNDVREYSPYLKINTKSDIVVRNSTVSANNTIITAEFDLILKDN